MKLTFVFNCSTNYNQDSVWNAVDWFSVKIMNIENYDSLNIKVYNFVRKN